MPSGGVLLLDQAALVRHGSLRISGAGGVPAGPAAGGLCCRLLLRLPPGANVDVVLDMENRTWSWWRDVFHCFYNQG